MEPMVQIDGAPFEEGQKIATAFFNTVSKHDRLTRLCAVTCIMMTWVFNEARAQGVSYDECIDSYVSGLKQSLNALDTEGTA